MRLSKTKNILKVQDSLSQTIPEYFSGKNVFITGGTGFMGKCLIEKLLRSCPDVGNIYVLIRNKRGRDPDNPLKKMTDNVIFDNLRQNNKSALNKLISVEGDTSKIGLGLSPEIREELINNVNIIYHMAASVRFNDPYDVAVFMNTRSTRDVCYLAMEIKNLEVFMHVSTAYSQHDKKTIEEKFYEPPYDWRKAIEIAENADPFILKMLTAKFMEGYPNTYTFTKAMSEILVKDLLEGKVPTIIIRPTIVVSSYREPFQGWVDNFNGPVTLFSAIGKGIIRSVYIRKSVIINSDMIPVDLVICGMIKLTWFHQCLSKDEVAIYNASNYNSEDDGWGFSFNTVMTIGTKVLENNPPKQIWYPTNFTTEIKLIHLIRVYLFQFLPALIVDSLSRLTNKKTKYLHLFKKIHVALESTYYFALNEWIILNDKFYEVDNYLIPADKESFFMEVPPVTYDFFLSVQNKVYELLFNDDPNRHEANVKRNKILKYCHLTMKTLFYGYCLYILFGILYYYIERYINYVYNLEIIL